MITKLLAQTQHGFRNLAEYEYYLGSQIWPNTNTIRDQKFGRIRILFGFRNMAEYEYKYENYSECHFCPNTNTWIIQIILNMNTNNTEYQYKHR